MKILVTGGAGFIGSNFILYWLAKYPQDSLINLDKVTYAGNLNNLVSIKDNPNYEFVRGDITDRAIVDKVMHGIDMVVHFAAESHVDRSIENSSPFILTNVMGTQVLLHSALTHKIKRFHHISTDEVFGSLSLEESKKFNEHTCYDPHSPYAATKAASDHLVRVYHMTYGLPITISNCSNNFGPYQFPEKFIPLVITNLLEGKNVPLYGDGLYVRDWLYVKDHCRAIDLILKKGKIGESYCIGGVTHDISNLDVVKKILHLLNKNESSIEYSKDRPGHDRKYSIDWTKIRTTLGFSPEHDFDSWLEKTVLWYKENSTWWQEVKNGVYHKYYKKQYGK